LHDLREALDLVKGTHFVKFDESVDMAVRLGVDPKHSDQMVRGSVVLPHGVGKTVTIIVFAKGEKEREARDAGADHVGADDLADRIAKGWMEFDRVVATPDLMGVVAAGQGPGPRGLMPNPKTGTVTFDLARAIREIRQGKVDYRVEKAGIVHVVVGKVSFDAAKLYDNTMAILESIIQAAGVGQGDVSEDHHRRPRWVRVKIDTAGVANTWPKRTTGTTTSRTIVEDRGSP
jgi:large subunit ribosomal protein L1